MSKVAVLSLLFALIVIFLVARAIMGIQSVTCEVCITYKGQTECRTGQGRTREDAQRTATDSACALLASGMTERIECGNTQPSRLSCK